MSYAALGYYRSSSFELGFDDRAALLASAEETLDCFRETGSREPVKARGSDALQSRRGVFVSLHRGDQLLGCMGHCPGREPLAEAVPDLALSAALEDPRFSPGDALASPFEVEISMLTPLRRIVDPEDFQVGRHGGFLKLPPWSGLLLPQVAPHHSWTATDFLRALAEKCGLATEAYQDPAARLYVFEAQVFSRAKP